MEFTIPDQGNNDEIDSDANPSTGMTDPIALQQQQSVMNVDAGLVAQSVLPVELVSFDVASSDCNADINWTTAAEINLSHYELQYSSDGVAFDEVKIIRAFGAGVSATNYFYKDTIHRTHGFYRLKMVDLDGTTEYSSIQALQADCLKEDRVTLFPNPFRNMFRMEIDSRETGQGQLMIYNQVGRLIKKTSLSISEGINSMDIDLPQVPVGTYITRLVINAKHIINGLFKTD